MAYITARPQRAAVTQTEQEINQPNTAPNPTPGASLPRYTLQRPMSY